MASDGTSGCGGAASNRAGGRPGPPARVGLPLVAVDFSQEIKDLRTTMSSVREVTDLAKLEAAIADLEKQASDPNLWDDQEKAQAVTSGLSRAKAEHDRVTGMDARVDDLDREATP